MNLKYTGDCRKMSDIVSARLGNRLTICVQVMSHFVCRHHPSVCLQPFISTSCVIITNLMHVIALLIVKALNEIVMCTQIADVNLYFIWIMFMFNQHKWAGLRTRADNTVYLPYSWRLHACFIEAWVTKQRSFGNIISAGNTARHADSR